MRSSWLTLAMKSRRDFSAASIRVTSCSTAIAPPEGSGAALTSKIRPGASELARPVRTSPCSSAPWTQASSSGSRTECTSGRPTRIWVPAMRCITALDQRTQPFRSNGDHRLLHGVEHGGQFLAAALDLRKALAQALGGLVQGGFHGRAIHRRPIVEPRAQIAFGNAPRKIDHPLQSAGDAQRQPMRPAAAPPPMQSAPTRETLASRRSERRCLHHALATKTAK